MPVRDPDVSMSIYLQKIEIAESGCWLWRGATNGKGYGRVGIGDKFFYVHRLFYERMVGLIPDGHELDHLCRTPPCVNPDHLEPVTHAENMNRAVHTPKTHCKNGHPFDDENTRRNARQRICVECRRAIGREWARKKREAERRASA